MTKWMSGTLGQGFGLWAINGNWSTTSTYSWSTTALSTVSSGTVDVNGDPMHTESGTYTTNQINTSTAELLSTLNGSYTILTQLDGTGAAPTGESFSVGQDNCEPTTEDEYALSLQADALVGAPPVADGQSRIAGFPPGPGDSQILVGPGGVLIPPSGIDSNGTPYWDGTNPGGPLPDRVEGGTLYVFAANGDIVAIEVGENCVNVG